MTSKERMFRALQGEQPDVVPAAPAYPGLFLADFERAFYVEQYRLRMRGRSRYPIDHGEDTRFRVQAKYQSYGIFKTRPDWIEISRGASRAWAEHTDIVLRDGILCYEDKVSGVRLPMRETALPRGNERLAAGNRSARDRWDTSEQVRSKEQVDARLPILSADELLARGDFDLPRQVVADADAYSYADADAYSYADADAYSYADGCRCGDQYFISTILDTPFSDAYDLLGFQGLMLIQYDQRDLFHYLLKRQLAKTQQFVEAWAAIGVHGVYVQEVFTGADLISPRSYDEFVFAYNQPYFRHMSGLGLLAIHYVCGDVVPRLDRIAQLDIAAVAVEESKKSFTIGIEDVVDRVAGRVAVFGNIDAVQFGIHATMKEMAAEVKRQIRIGARAKGFVVSTGSPFPLDTNPRLIDTLVVTAHSHSARGPG